ncbi:MAG: metalloregulator ArsR/SmtB family transcription factor, partial [Methylocella sp.]
MFAALGDETRLSIVTKLCRGQPQSISQLTKGSKLTRQAITKHLRVLETAGVVHSVRSGRESLYEYEPE